MLLCFEFQKLIHFVSLHISKDREPTVAAEHVPNQWGVLKVVVLLNWSNYFFSLDFLFIYWNNASHGPPVQNSCNGLLCNFWSVSLNNTPSPLQFYMITKHLTIMCYTWFISLFDSFIVKALTGIADIMPTFNLLSPGVHIRGHSISVVYTQILNFAQQV